MTRVFICSREIHVTGRLLIPFSAVMRPSFLLCFFLRARPSRTSQTCRNMSTIRSYADAVQHLNSLQSNAAVLDAVRASGGRSSEFAIPEMLEYLGRIGYTVRVYLNASCVKTQFGVAAQGLKCTERYPYHGNQGKRFYQCFHGIRTSSFASRKENRCSTCQPVVDPLIWTMLRLIYISPLGCCTRKDKNKWRASVRGTICNLFLRSMG